MRREYINKASWIKLRSFLKSSEKIYCGCEEKSKNFLEAIFWMARTGAQWRELPSDYGKWNSVFSRFNTWAKKGVWGRFLTFCSEDPDLEYVMIDATIVRAHACAAGYGKQETEGLGRSKGGFTSKIHVKVDALGNPLKFIVTAGQRNDITQANTLLIGESGSYVIADKGYDSDDFRFQLLSQDCEPVIPSKSNRREPWNYDEFLYKERHAVECFFSKMKHFRRVFSRFDKSSRNFIAFLSFVGALLWLR